MNKHRMMSEGDSCALPESVSYEDILASEGRIIATNVGTSMMPLIRQGRDLMVIQAFPPLEGNPSSEKKHASDGPESKRSHEEEVSGGSRKPFVRRKTQTGDSPAAAQAKKQAGVPRAKRYDAVLYRCGKRYILHRVLRVEEDGYTICGDHCIRRDRHVPESAVLGVLVHVDREGKPLPVDMHWDERGNDKPPLRYRAYVHLWCDLFPARVAMLTAKRFGGGALRRMKRQVKKHVERRRSV